METNPNVRIGEANVWGSNFTNFPVLRQVTRTFGGQEYRIWESPHAMVIDNNDSGGDLDEDGTYGEVWPTLSTKNWEAKMDTHAFKDGPLRVHYIVMDDAGNATKYYQDIYIENNKPQIANINVGTSVFGNLSLVPWSENNPGEYRRNPFNVGISTAGNSIITFTTPYEPGEEYIADRPFRIQGRMLGLRMSIRGGNNAKYYTVSYVEPRANNMPATSMVRGGVYTIVSGGTTDWLLYGAPNNIARTTFVATGPGEGTGTVIDYTYVRTTTPRQITTGSTGLVENDIVFNAADFDHIPDSTGTYHTLWPVPWRTNIHWPQRFFIIKVYDQTVPGAREQDQQAHAVLVGMNVNNVDSTPPVITVAPFGREHVVPTIGNPPVPGNPQAPTRNLVNLNENDNIPATYDQTAHVAYMNNYNKNIVMEGNVRKGYVEYGTGANLTGTANISGKVIFTGTASDNQRISRIFATITGYGSEFEIARWNSDTNRLQAHSSAGFMTNTIAQLASDTSPNEWAFEVTGHLTMDHGHVVDWKFAWDTSSLPAVAANNVNITFRAEDSSGNPSTNSTLNVNIVPYITEVVTELSHAYDPPSAFARSANGWYSVRENEVLIINGFNLGRSSSPVVNPTVRINATPLAAGVNLVNRNRITANIGEASVSGNLDVIVSSIASYNNSSVKTRRYNTEPNNVNNNILTNARKLYIWNTGYVINDNVIMNPFMRMDNSGRRIVSFAEYISIAGGTATTNEGRLQVVLNNTGLNASARTEKGTRSGGDPGTVNRPHEGTATSAPNVVGPTVLYQTGMFLNTTLAVSYGNNEVNWADGREWAVMASNLTSGQSNLQFVFNRIRANNSNAAGTGANANIRMRNLGIDPFRIQIPRVAMMRTGTTTATAGIATFPNRMVVSYFDATHTVTTPTATNGSRPLILHAFSHNGNATWTGAPTDNAADPPAASAVAFSDIGTARSGMYHAVGFLTTGRPVIAWYDSYSTPTRLWFSYGDENGATTTTANYQSRAIQIDLNVGTHVDLAVDSDNNVHLAYVHALNGGLYYAMIPFNGATPGTIVRNRVDTFLFTGQKLMINVRAGKPYISYFHNAFNETRNSIKVAWLKGTTPVNQTSTVVGTGGTVGNFFTGHWEVMTVPAENIPLSSEFVCNGVPTSGTFVRPNGSTLRDYTAIGTSIFVSYMTNRWYEGAVLKANIPALVY
jgi:hypothetical protein